MDTKLCTKCKQDKGLTLFGIDKRAKDGHQSCCRVCSNKQSLISHKKNIVKTRDTHKKWSITNKDKVLFKAAGYRAKHKGAIKIRHRKWRMNNKAKILANVRKYQASKIQAVPKWADLKSMQDIYRKCPVGYHVDHIIPLRGKLVSGLHIPENLQYLTAKENRKKFNLFEVI